MNTFRTPLLSRRAALGLVLAGTSALTVRNVPGFEFVANAESATNLSAAQKIADHFSKVRTMTGEFVQFGPRGEQTGGKFYIQRPGRIRFNYEAPSSFRVISDGTSVAIDNRKLNTMDVYPLSKTPLKMLLDDHIDLSGKQVKSVRQDDDLTTIQLGDKQIFGNSKITMMFDPSSYELRQWTITDAQGKDTTVMIFNTKQDVALDASLFKIDYRRNLELNTKKIR
ncbi:MAG: outer membrane lipoprotein carrier protein LolA [Rhizobiales bacterium]|nr:outer membrane lipoprotein carrier protein LolA [Hyphomicrobiales bacterium]